MTIGRPLALYDYKGQRLTALQLAEIADCTPCAMRKRLMTRTPEDAVAAGPLDPRNVPGLYPYQGQMLTTRQLAMLAGCDTRAMRRRLAIHDTEAAVGMGPPCSTRHKLLTKPPKLQKPKPPPKVKAAPKVRVKKPATPKQTAQRETLKAKPAGRKTPVYAKLDKSAPAICNVKPQVSPPPPGRFEVTGPVMRVINSNECSAWARAATGG